MFRRYEFFSDKELLELGSEGVSLLHEEGKIPLTRLTEIEVLRAASASPTASGLHDELLVRARHRIEKRLPPDPSAGKNLASAILEQLQLPDKPKRR